MLTQFELNQIKEYLALYGKKDSQLENAELPLTGAEYVAIVQKGKNKKTPLYEIIEALQGNLSKDTLTYSEYLALEAQGKVKTNTIYICTTENGDHTVQVFLQGNKLLNIKYGPYESLQDALSDITSDERFEGMTVGVDTGTGLLEYWFKGGVLDANLQLKTIINPVTYEDQTTKTSDAEKNIAYSNLSDRISDSVTGKLGYKVLQTSTRFQTQVSAENTVYEVRDVFDLGGTQENPVTVSLPANSTLKFNGGILKNCTLVGNNSKIESDPYSNIFDNTVLSGVWDVDQVSICWLGAKNSLTKSSQNPQLMNYDCLSAINLCLSSSIVNVFIPTGCWYVSDTINITSKHNIILDGEDKTKHYYINTLVADNQIGCAIIYTDQDIDVFRVNITDENGITISGGRIDVTRAKTASQNYTKSAIFVDVSNGCNLMGLSIKSHIIGQDALRPRTDETVQSFVDSNSKGIYIHISGDTYSYATGINISGSIYGFRYGILCDRADGANASSWATEIVTQAFIKACIQYIVLHEGAYSVLRGTIQCSRYFNDDDTSSLYKDRYPAIEVRTRFVTIDTIIWDVNNLDNGWYSQGKAIELLSEGNLVPGNSTAASYVSISDNLLSQFAAKGLISYPDFISISSKSLTKRGDTHLQTNTLGRYFDSEIGEQYYNKDFDGFYIFDGNGDFSINGEGVSFLKSDNRFLSYVKSGKVVFIPNFIWADNPESIKVRYFFNMADKANITKIISMADYHLLTCENLLREMSNLKTIPWFDTTGVMNFKAMCSGCSSLVEFPPLDTASGTKFTGIFAYCNSLVKIGELNLSNCTDEVSLSSCSKLTHFGGFVGMKCNIAINGSTYLTYQSYLNVLNKVSSTPNSGATITFPGTNAEPYKSFTTNQKNTLISLANTRRGQGWTVSGIGSTTI